MKPVSKVLIFTLAFLGLNFLCKSITDDVCLDFLVPPEHVNSPWKTPEPSSEITEILSQKYTYLTKGKQAYVFTSEDGLYVLKLFKPLSPFIEVPFFGKTFHIGLGKLPFAKMLTVDFSSPSFQKMRDLEFQSYKNAFSFLQEETQIKYLHLTKTSTLKKQLRLYDKIGIFHTIDLDNTSFLLQKKTDLLYPTLAKLLKNQELDKAKELLRNFVSFYFELIEKKVVNPSTLEKNIGCQDLKPIQIDVGRILTPENLHLEHNEVPLTQIYKSTAHMKKWLKFKNPELCAYLKQIEEETFAKKRRALIE